MPPEASSGTSAQWMRNARADLDLAKMPASSEDVRSLLSFHCQQAVEKALKAVMVRCGLTIPYTHNLQRLIDLLPAQIPLTDEVRDAARLSAYAVTTRYPNEDEPVPDEDFREALRLAEAVVHWAEDTLK